MSWTWDLVFNTITKDSTRESGGSSSNAIPDQRAKMSTGKKAWQRGSNSIWRILWAKGLPHITCLQNKAIEDAD